MKLGNLAWTWLATVVLLAWFSLQFPSPRAGGRPPARQRAPEAPARTSAARWLLDRSFYSRNMRYRAADSRRRISWDLFVRSARYARDRRRLEGTGIRCVFRGRNQAPVAVVVARAAVMNPDTQDVAFKGAVRARTARGTVLIVDRLWYNGRKKRLFGNGGVHITRRRTLLTADTMAGDPGLADLTIKGHVRVKILSAGAGVSAGRPPSRRAPGGVVAVQLPSRRDLPGR